MPSDRVSVLFVLFGFSGDHPLSRKSLRFQVGNQDLSPKRCIDFASVVVLQYKHFGIYLATN